MGRVSTKTALGNPTSDRKTGAMIDTVISWRGNCGRTTTWALGKVSTPYKHHPGETDQDQACQEQGLAQMARKTSPPSSTSLDQDRQITYPGPHSCAKDA